MSVQFDRIVSLHEGAAAGTYKAVISASLDGGETFTEMEYGINPGDTEGIAVAVHEAKDQWIADGKAVEPYSVPPVSPGAVDAERDRRIDGGFHFGGVFYQSRPSDRENIAGASTNALGAIMNGAAAGDLRWHGGASDFVWIAADNSENAMDAQTMFAFGQAAMAHKQSHIFAARALKDASPIPSDYADDAYWPVP